jgi:hypothetical protein
VSCRALKAFVAGRREERVPTELALSYANGEGVARNVSVSGIYFITNGNLKKGEAVELKITFRDFPGGSLEVTCYADVVRIENFGREKGVGAAIRSFEFRRKSDGQSRQD